jgi:hypothetical protein
MEFFIILLASAFNYNVLETPTCIPQNTLLSKSPPSALAMVAFHF